MARNAFNLIVSAVAAVATFALTGGNLAAAAAVFSLGNLALNILNPSTPSADLDDLRANKSSYGEPIPIIYNEVRLGGHMVWASDVRAKERGHGGYEYGQDFRWIICERPRLDNVGEFYVTIKQIFLNKQLVFDVDPDAQLSNILALIGENKVVLNNTGQTIIKFSPTLTALSNLVSGSRGIQQFTIYYGDQDQQPHPVQAAAMGFDNAPAYRGVISVACDNAPVHLYGNAPPQIEVVLTVWTTGVTPDYITYDPIWEEGNPVEPGYPMGYRTMVSNFASPSYHPGSMVMQVMDNEEYANSPPAIGRRSVATGEWETGSPVLIDYGDGAGAFIWDEFIPPVVWPPTSSKFYTVKFRSTFTDTLNDFQWVEMEATPPFAFSKRSPTPQDKGRSDYWGRLHACSYNAAATMLVGQHNGSGISPDIHTKWTLWAPGPNAIGFFKSNDAGFSGRYGTGLTGTGTTPQGFVIDKHDHLWVFTHAVVDQAVPIWLDEYSWSIVGTDITLTHLNRYQLNNQLGGFNTWSYVVYGATYNEDLDEIVFHWDAAFPSDTHTTRDPVAINFGGSGNTPTQYRITHWDLTTRSKKLSDADSILITKASDGLLLTDFGNTSEEPNFSGVPGFLGSDMNEDGDRYIGTWTKQDWSCYVCRNEPASYTAITDGFFIIDIDTGVATKYALWETDLLPGDFEGGPDPPGTEGVYSFAGAVWEPTTFCFWAGRRNQGFAGYYGPEPEQVWYYTTEGFGRYFINPGAVARPYNLQQINEDIADRTGSLDVGDDTEFSALSEIEPWGYAITNRAPARSAIEQLQTAFLYDVYESDHILKAKLRIGNSVIVTIDESEVLAEDESSRNFVFKDNNEMERPRYIDLRYISRERNHQSGVAPARIGGGTISDRNALTIELPVVMEASDSESAPGAHTTVQRILRTGWAEREEVSFGLMTRYLPYEVADIALLTRGSFSFETKLAQDGLGVNFAKQLGVVTHDSGLYSSTAKGTVRDFTPPPLIKLVPAPRMVVLDTGLMSEALDTIGYHVTAIPEVSEAQGGLWNGATIEGPGTTSTNFAEFGFVVQGPVGGLMQEVLAEPDSAFTWDRDSIIKVYMTRGAPVSYDEAALIANPLLGLYWVGGSSGAGELLQAATASKKAAGVYWLSNLLRGRFGTEQHVADHAADEVLVLWDTTKFLPVTYDRFSIDATRYWRARNSSPQQFSDVVTADQATRRLWPLAPYPITVARDSGDNVIITFLRRSRTRADDLLNDPPVFEDMEDYEADILGVSDALVRTITTTASAGGSYVDADGDFVLYSAVDQVTDWGSLLAEGIGDAAIYQLSAIVGRGYPGRTAL